MTIRAAPAGIVVGVLGQFIGKESAARRRFGQRSLGVYSLGPIERISYAAMVPFGVPSLVGLVPKDWCDIMHALVVTSDGGHEVGESEEDPSARRHSELALIKEVLDRGLPVLAVSGGVGRLLSALHPSDSGTPADGYVGSVEPRVPTTLKITVTDRELHSVFGPSFDVSVPYLEPPMGLGAGLAVAAVDESGAARIATATTGPVLAVQWHPERMEPGSVAADGPFLWLSQQARLSHQGEPMK